MPITPALLARLQTILPLGALSASRYEQQCKMWLAGRITSRDFAMRTLRGMTVGRATMEHRNQAETLAQMLDLERDAQVRTTAIIQLTVQFSAHYHSLTAFDRAGIRLRASSGCLRFTPSPSSSAFGSG